MFGKPNSNLENKMEKAILAVIEKLEILHFYKAITKKAGWLVLIGF
jgi:hypothetical protein